MNKAWIYIISVFICMNGFIMPKSSHTKMHHDNVKQFKEKPGLYLFGAWLLFKYYSDQNKKQNSTNSQSNADGCIDNDGDGICALESSGSHSRYDKDDSDTGYCLSNSFNSYGRCISAPSSSSNTTNSNCGVSGDDDYDGICDNIDRCIDGDGDRWCRDDSYLSQSLEYDADDYKFCSSNRFNPYGGCIQGAAPIYGCTNENACNFNPKATSDDNSCLVPHPDCNCDDDSIDKKYKCNDQIYVCSQFDCPTPTRIHVEYWNNGSIKVEGKYTNNKKDGLWKWYFNSNNKQIQKIGKYIIGKEQGEWIEYYLSGRPKEIINYKKSIKHGSYVFLDDYEQKTYLEKGSYRNGLKNGRWEQHYSGGEEKSGNIKYIINYTNDKKDGLWFEYYNNSRTFNKKIKQKGKYLNGNEVGEWFWYYEALDFDNMQLQQQGTFDSNGKEIGKWIKYYQNNQIKSEKWYDNSGNKTKLWVEWFESGNYKKKITYKNNKKTDETVYYKNGNKKRKGNYNNDGKRDGKWYFYDKEGKIKETKVFLDGEEQE